MKYFNGLLLYLLLSITTVKAREQQIVPFTLADRYRIIRTEIKLDALESKMNARFAAIDARFAAIDAKFEAIDTKFEAIDTKFEALNSRIDDVFWTMGVMVALIISIFGYLIWNCRTAIKPFLEKAEAAESLSSINTKIFRDYAKDQPGLAAILKKHGLL